MNPNLQEEEVFDAALGITNPEQLRSFLDEACSGDPRLRARVESLLALHQAAEKFFSDLPPFSAPDSVAAEDVSAAIKSTQEPGRQAESTLTEGPGTLIGRYKLLERIGEGGCGVVYMADQEEPVRRRVALKVIKLGMDTKSVIARFEAERQALAMMDHPNIARVFDAGATETGRPFFVMELVRGIKLTDYCDQNNLDTCQRLDLFIQICHAIQHAHQKGIIHRDIKPSNVLVTLRDGVPVPKVIDFGIAKATEGRLTDMTYFTPYQQFIGTPAYMSPEQAERSDLDIDTRSDIYSLGVLLYELLTGRTPFDTNRLLRSGLSEMRRTLRETEPQRPSTMITTMHGEELAQTALRRHAETPPKLISQLRGDLDWIVMKSLDKDRRRRYETANALAMDIQRHLDNEPVTARPPSRLYQFRKLVRRNRAAFAAAAAVTVALFIGLGFTTWFYLKERDARRRAVGAEQQQKRLREDAELAQKRELELRQQADAMRHQAEIRELITQAALFVSQNKFNEADHLAATIPLAQPSLEAASVFRSLGEWHATNWNWKPASESFTALLQVNKLDRWDVSTSDYLRAGLALAELGDASEYERFRQGAVLRFAKIENPVVAERILRTCLLEPADKTMLGALEPMAKELVSMAGGSLKTPEVPLGRDSDRAVHSGPAGNSVALPAASDLADADSAGGNPPLLRGASSFDGMSVGVEFSKPEEAIYATNPMNYSVTGTTVTNVQLASDGKSAVLWLASQISNEFVVTVTNVFEPIGNSTPPRGVAGGRVINLRLHDFNTAQPFSASYAGNVATIKAGGADIWESRDQFIYDCTSVSGDFDYRLKIISIFPPWDSYTRVGLMARDSLADASCREVTVGVNATNTFQVLVRTTAAGGTASQPPNPLPDAFGSNSWVRLQRTGSVFHAYCSSNGTDWVQLYQFDSVTGPDGPFADPIYLGIATCSHSARYQATAVVSDLGVTPTVPARIMVALALMEYRRGAYTKTVEWCRRCLTAYPEYSAPRNATARILFAMSCQHLGETGRARSELAECYREIDKKFKSGLDPNAGAPDEWFDWVYAHVLLGEATELIGSTP